jgi:hypothetical protein
VYILAIHQHSALSMEHDITSGDVPEETSPIFRDANAIILLWGYGGVYYEALEW